jgi:endonuclease/exonuclease/phosphatase family metal-dependent hydrolase
VTKLLITLSLLIGINCHADTFKVMSFNTLCDFCADSTFDSFTIRKKSIKKIISSANADLYSLQEVRSEKDVKFFFSDTNKYKLFFLDTFLISYADPALAINTERFTILDNGQFWLGPNGGSFSFGWKYALPRQVIWVKLQDKIKGFSFIFIGSHFDNRVENMIGSANMIDQFIQKQNIPVIFAADTNCTVDFEGYTKLVSNKLENTFDSAKVKKGDSIGDKVCYLRKGDTFPDCRVDHILYSKNSPWKVLNWEINTYKEKNGKNYPSDHRPISATFSY